MYANRESGKHEFRVIYIIAEKELHYIFSMEHLRETFILKELCGWGGGVRRQKRDSPECAQQLGSDGGKTLTLAVDSETKTNLRFMQTSESCEPIKR